MNCVLRSSCCCEILVHFMHFGRVCGSFIKWCVFNENKSVWGIMYVCLLFRYAYEINKFLSIIHRFPYPLRGRFNYIFFRVICACAQNVRWYYAHHTVGFCSIQHSAVRVISFFFSLFALRVSIYLLIFMIVFMLTSCSVYQSHWIAFYTIEIIIMKKKI